MVRVERTGAVLPIMAIGVIALLGIAALVLDMGIYLNSVAQARRKAEVLALAGISEYNAALRRLSAGQPTQTALGATLTCQSGSGEAAQSCWMQKAAMATRDRIRVIGRVNTLIGEAVSESQQALEQIENSILLGSPIPDTAHGEFQLGKYEWIGPQAHTFTPGSSFSASTEGGYAAFNAIRVTARAEGENAMRAALSGVLGTERLGYQATAIATLIPRNDVMLIDLSSSVFRDNHLRFGQTNPSAIDPICTTADRWSRLGYFRCAFFGTGADFAYLLDPRAYGSLGCPIGDPGAQARFQCQGCNSSAVPGAENPCGARNYPYNPLDPNNKDYPLLPPLPVVPVSGENNDLRCGIAECLSPPCCANPPQGCNEAEVRWHFQMWNWLNPLTGGDGIYSWTGTPPPPEGAVSSPGSQWLNPVAHFRRNYKCRTVNFDATRLSPGGSGSLTRAVLVNVGAPYNGTANSYLTFVNNTQRQPEPLWSILSAASAGMKAIYQRGVNIDRFALVGFDDTIRPRSQTCEDPSVSPAQPMCKLVSPNSQSFAQFLDATDVTRTAGDVNTDFISKALFPVPRSQSNLQLAIMQAASRIASPDNANYSIAKNNILLVTDGLANCPYVYDPTAPGCDYDGATPWNCFIPRYVPVNPRPLQTIGPTCSNRPNYVLEAIQSLTDSRLVDKLVELRISVSIAMVGTKTGGHYVLVKSSQPGGGCVNETEAYATRATNYVDSAFSYYSGLAPETLENLYYDESQRFYAPNELYTGLVQPTGGIWRPIIPRLEQGGTPVNFNETILTTCSQSIAAGTVFAGVTHNGATVTDPLNGRLLFDPLGRTVAEQLEDAVDTVLASPFVLVEEQ